MGYSGGALVLIVNKDTPGHEADELKEDAELQAWALKLIRPQQDAVESISAEAPGCDLHFRLGQQIVDNNQERGVNVVGLIYDFRDGANLRILAAQ